MCFFCGYITKHVTGLALAVQYEMLFHLYKSLSCIVQHKGAAKCGPSENNKEKVTISYRQGTEVYHQPKTILIQSKRESEHSCVSAVFARNVKETVSGWTQIMAQILLPLVCFLWKRWPPIALLRNFNYVLREAGDRALWECQATPWRDEWLAFNVMGD